MSHMYLGLADERQRRYPYAIAALEQGEGLKFHSVIERQPNNRKCISPIPDSRNTPQEKWQHRTPDRRPAKRRAGDCESSRGL